MGGNPSFLLFLIFYFVLFVVVISRIDIFASKFGGRSLSAHSGFSSPLSIVFRYYTLGTMCHLSLGVGSTFLSIVFSTLVIVFRVIFFAFVPK